MNIADESVILRRKTRYIHVGKRKENNNGGRDAEHDVYGRIVKYSGVFGGVQGLVILVTVIRTKIVARLLGTVGFGINEAFNRTINLVRSTTDLGLPFSAVRSISVNYEENDTAMLSRSVTVTRSWTFLTAMAGALLCFALSPLFSLWAFEGDRGYTLSIILLSPAVAFSIITGGEMAVLKGLRKLREIAVSQLLSVILALSVSVPLFYFLGLLGLVPSLVAVSFLTMATTCFFSFRAMPYRIALLDRSILKQGTGMVRLGVFFTIASFLGSGAFAVIANYMMKYGSSEVLGAYSAGYALMNYLGIFVFSAMESDYFPRLSSAADDREESMKRMNQQIEIAVLLIAPMVTAFIVFLEPIVKLLLTDEFCMAVPMARIAALSLYLKAVTQPMEYFSLAKGDSRTFLLLEAIYDVFFVLAVILGFSRGGLMMTGAAITITGLFNVILVIVVVRKRFGLHLTAQTRSLIAILPWPMLLALFTSFRLHGAAGWLSGTALLAVSVLISYRELRRRTSFLDKLFDKISKFTHR